MSAELYKQAEPGSRKTQRKASWLGQSSLNCVSREPWRPLKAYQSDLIQRSDTTDLFRKHRATGESQV